MRKLLSLTALISLHIITFSQDFTNKGKDFWIGYGNHVRMFNSGTPETMQLYITSDVSTTGSVDIPGIGSSQPFTVTANQITTLNIQRNAALFDEGLFNTGIHVTADKPVVVYGFIYVNSISGATLCLPTNTLGREYYSINYTQISNEANSYSYFFAVAADTGKTTLEITPSQGTKGGRPAGVPFQVDLTQGQVYQVLSLTDLTGSTIKSVNNGSGCKRIAVFCGSGKISIGCSSAGTSDNLYQQMYPTSTWGKTYITVPSINKPNLTSQNNFIRIFESDPSAVVRVNGSVLAPSNFINGQYATMGPSNLPYYVESDKPILVAQYLTTQGCSNNVGNGDPEMIYVNPIEQTVSNVTLNSMQPSVNTNINEHYINAVLKNDPDAINTFKIDGIPYGGSFKVHPFAPNYMYAQIPVTMGTHTITCDTPFNAIAYGYGNAESYGYSAGTNLKDLYQFVSIQNDYATVNFPAGCKQSPFKFAMTFPYQPTSVTWKFNGLFPDTTIISPVADSIWVVNGRTLYQYRLNKSFQINSTGTYPISLVAINPTLDGCTGVQTIDYDLQIFDRPTANFTYNFKGCTTDSIQLLDNTDGLGRQIIKYFWDYGDANGSEAKSPVYKYNAAGTYVIKHAAVTDVGCLSDTMKTQVIVSPLPTAAFNFTGPTCQNKQVSFTDLSTANAGTVNNWTWTFGNGQSSAVKNPVNTFAATGAFNVTLVVTNSKGCVSNIATKQISINYNPLANFITPEVCLADPFAPFTDSSHIGDGSEAQFTYLWNFGDGNTSTQQNPQHKYASVGVYPVALIVTSKDGCKDTANKQFTVNGSLPQANFTLNNPNAVCSNQDVTIRNTSTVDFGNIVKVEVYWDYTNDPTIKTVDDNPDPGKMYAHRYPDFGSPATKSYEVRYVAYSGINCISQTVQNITVKASPAIFFDALAGVCEEIKPFKIPVAKEINSLGGSGFYSGAGLSEDGTFDPHAAGPGIHTLRYTFNASNGCSASGEQTIQVFPTPFVNAGPDRTALEGGSIQLQGQGNGNNVSFLWTPAVGILNAHTPTPTVSPADDITYTLTVTSADQCVASDMVFVKVLKKPVVPNAFTPNGDGINDKWVIQFLDTYPGCTVDIYNRYGQRVFFSTGYGKPWDGTLNGNPLPVGTYYWIINPKNGRAQMNGAVTILR